MKKLLILAGIIALTSTMQVMANDGSEDTKTCPKATQKCERRTPDCAKQDRMHRPPLFDKEKFEQKLNLTEEQKVQLEQLRAKEKELSKPIFEQLKAKEKEVRELRDQLRTIHVENKKEFKAILTEEQLQTLEQMKQEHRTKFNKAPKGDMHKKGMHKRPPMMPECRCDKK